jgi:hypothetical protein
MPIKHWQAFRASFGRIATLGESGLHCAKCVFQFVHGPVHPGQIGRFEGLVSEADLIVMVDQQLREVAHGSEAAVECVNGRVGELSGCLARLSPQTVSREQTLHAPVKGQLAVALPASSGATSAAPPVEPDAQ